jgi:hypothetical protein
MRDWIRAACDITIYAAERVLEVLDAQRPLHDEPLPDGHSDDWPDELWTPPGGSLATLIFDTELRDRSGLGSPCIDPQYLAEYERLIEQATTNWNPDFDPRRN